MLFAISSSLLSLLPSSSSCSTPELKTRLVRGGIESLPLSFFIEVDCSRAISTKVVILLLFYYIIRVSSSFIKKLCSNKGESRQYKSLFITLSRGTLLSASLPSLKNKEKESSVLLLPFYLYPY